MRSIARSHTHTHTGLSRLPVLLFLAYLSGHARAHVLTTVSVSSVHRFHGSLVPVGFLSINDGQENKGQKLIRCANIYLSKSRES
jgi:hypothetical protein